MVRAWRGSLQGRLMVGIILLAALGMVVVNVASLAWLRIYLVEAADANLTQVRGAFQGSVESQAAPVAETTLTALVPEGGYIVLLDDHGRVVAQTPGRGLNGQSVPRPGLPTPVPNGFAEHVITLSAEGALLPRVSPSGSTPGSSPLPARLLRPSPPWWSPRASRHQKVSCTGCSASMPRPRWPRSPGSPSPAVAWCGWTPCPLRDMATTATAIAWRRPEPAHRDRPTPFRARRGRPRTEPGVRRASAVREAASAVRGRRLARVAHSAGHNQGLGPAASARACPGPRAG